MLHSILENKNERTDDLCFTTINEHLDLAVTEVDIEPIHRIGNPRDVGQKSRPIIVKFVRYNDRKNVFNRNKKLKGKKEYLSYGEFNSHANEKFERSQGNSQF